jgi:hypothetical protein
LRAAYFNCLVINFDFCSVGSTRCARDLKGPIYFRFVAHTMVKELFLHAHSKRQQVGLKLIGCGQDAREFLRDSMPCPIVFALSSSC